MTQTGAVSGTAENMSDSQSSENTLFKIVPGAVLTPGTAVYESLFVSLYCWLLLQGEACECVEDHGMLYVWELNICYILTGNRTVK